MFINRNIQYYQFFPILFIDSRDSDKNLSKCIWRGKRPWRVKITEEEEPSWRTEVTDFRLTIKLH